MTRGERQTDLFVYFSIRVLVWLPEPFFRLFLLASTYLLAANNTPVRRAVQGNLDIAFPEMNNAARRRLARKIIYENGLLLYESGNLNRPRVQKSVEATGLAHLERAMAGGKGVVALSAHLGNFALLLSYLSRRYPVKAVVNDPANLYTAGDIREIRRRAGIREIRKKPAAAAIQESLDWLKSGGILLLLADEYRKKGVTVPFFSLPSGTQTAPAVFSRRLGCTVVPVSVVRRGKNHLIRVGPPLEMVHSQDPESDIRDNTALCNRVIERWVREDPAEWFGWFGKRFLPANEKTTKRS